MANAKSFTDSITDDLQDEIDTLLTSIETKSASISELEAKVKPQR